MRSVPKIASLARQVGRRPRVHLEEWGPSEPYYLAGDWAVEMLILAGADNAFDDRKLRCRSRDRVVTGAEIASRDPDIIITAWCGCNEKVDLGRVAQRSDLRDTMAHALRATVRAGHLVVDEPVDLPEGTVVDLVPISQTAHPRPKFGSARGRVQMAPDFDAPLDDFADYVP